MTAIVPYGMRGLEQVTWDPTVTFCSEGRRFLTYDARVRISRKFRSQSVLSSGRPTSPRRSFVVSTARIPASAYSSYDVAV